MHNIKVCKKNKLIQRNYISDLSCAFEINPDSAARVKREIEKKEYYCRLI